MKFIRIVVFTLFMAPFVSNAATSDFMMAAQLLAAAKSADIAQVQSLVNSGADVNFVDATGLSIVCTALMNNDVRAAQILQMYGADASGCDRQIKRFNNKNKPKGSGGLFSGLSSAQSIGLTAAGAAVVVGGLFLLTDVFDPGNDNDSASSGGNRPDNNPGTDTGGSASEGFAKLPYGPACNTTTGACNDVNEWSPDADTVRAWDFNYMKPFNYLMMAYAYNSFARGYMGMDTIRIASDKTPFYLGNLPFVGDVPGGGRPVAVATITTDGVNASGSLADGLLTWVDETKIPTVQSMCSQYGNSSAQCQNALSDATRVSRKFYNRSNLSDLNDATERSGFDFSGHGTVFGDASDAQSLNAKVVAGWEYGGRATGDAYGFVPNGQLSVYRTGGGLAKDAVVGTVSNASDTTNWSNGDTFSVNGAEYKFVVADDGAISAVNTTDDSDVVSIVQNGNVLRFEINQVDYEALFKGDVNSLKQIDLMNYSAMLGAAQLRDSGVAVNSVIANIAQNPQAIGVDYLNMRDFKALMSGLSTDAAKKSLYASYINKYYNLDVSDDETVNKPGYNADALYTLVGNNQEQIIVNSVGAYEYGVGDGKSVEALAPTFENFAPALYPNMEHLFASVVAVQNQKGTSAIDKISEYTGANSSVGKITLSKWGTGYDDNGTPDDVSDDTYEHIFSSRKCGDAGVGLNGIDPWCFAAPGVNSEMAVASMAGGIASVQSAFAYLTNQQVFTLMALTADGAYLGTNPGTGRAWGDDAELVSYLQARYELPGEYSPSTDAEYLAAFKDVFGYGIINLERATRPGTTVYYYDGKNIVSANGNAYWRAATNTMFRPSAVLNVRGASVRAPFFDVLESADGQMKLPRVWENEFAFGEMDKGGLYMGDVLGDLKTRRDVAKRHQFGNIDFEMSFSERAYDDNLNGLDNLSLGYSMGAWNFGASYQRYLTDGVSRFGGMSNPIMGLASNALVSDVEYGVGNWTFGARAFSGAITDEGLLENDPTIAAQYIPGRLGMMQGGAANVMWKNNLFEFNASIGNAHETNTLLGAQTGGLLDLGHGDTVYVDAVARYQMSDAVDITARATFAQTSSNAGGDFILGLTDIKSNAFAIGANIGNFEFSVAQPLAITDGALQYAYADYDIVHIADNKYELDIRDAHVADIGLASPTREVRFMGTYRHRFSAFTDGAVGFIYRVNPNHTDAYGNESVFMFKMTHRLGI